MHSRVWICSVTCRLICTVQTTDMWHCRSLCVDINIPTSLVLFSIPGVPGAHQLTGVVLISVDGGQNLLTVRNKKHQPNTEIQLNWRQHSILNNIIWENQISKEKKRFDAALAVRHITCVIFYTPSYEIQLCNSRMYFIGCTWNSIRYFRWTTKWVKKFFTIPI